MNRYILFSVFLFALLVTGCGNKPGTAASEASPDSTATAVQKVEKKSIVFFGNSLTAGYGVDPGEAFPALIEQKIDSLNLPYTVTNGGVSGETSAGGNQRIDFVVKQQSIDVFVLELGANDGLRGISPAETKKNLKAIIDKVKAGNPQVKLVLAGMQMPPNMGQGYTTAFRKLYPELAKENNISLIPFLLEGVADVPRLNLEDGIHPTPEGHRVVAENVWAILQPVLQ